MLVSVDPSEVLRLRQVLGAKRPDVFEQAEKFFQDKYGLTGLPLLVIDRVLSRESKREALFEVLKHGDCPEYVVSIYEKFRIDSDFFGYALYKKRWKSAFAILELTPKEDLWKFIASSSTDVISNQCSACLQYIASKVDLNDALIKSLNYPIEPVTDVEYVLRITDHTVSPELLNVLLKRSDSDFLKWVLPKLTDKELFKVRADLHKYSSYDKTQLKIRDITTSTLTL